MKSRGKRVSLSVIPAVIYGILSFAWEEALTKIMPTWFSGLVEGYPYVVLALVVFLSTILYLSLSFVDLKVQMKGMLVPRPNYPFKLAVECAKKNRKWKNMDETVIRAELHQAARIGSIVAYGQAANSLFDERASETLERIPPEFFRDCCGDELSDGDIIFGHLGFCLESFSSTEGVPNCFQNVTFNEEQIQEWLSRNKPLKS